MYQMSILIIFNGIRDTLFCVGDTIRRGDKVYFSMFHPFESCQKSSTVFLKTEHKHFE